MKKFDINVFLEETRDWVNQGETPKLMKIDIDDLLDKETFRIIDQKDEKRKVN